MSTDHVAFLGPEATFTSEAARLAAPHAERVPLPTITDVVEAVRCGRCVLGVVPIENSIEGSVTLTLDELALGEPGAYIRGELTIPISMALLGRPGADPRAIKVVRSQPHALAQCRRWLAANLPDARLEASTSTAEAARQAAEGTGEQAALGPLAAGERYGLEVLAQDIQDYPDNTTRFAVLGRQMSAPTGADKTSLVVFFGEDRPGLLLRILDEFALRGINLTKVESRPTKQQLGQYCIFIDCAAHLTEARLAEALRNVHRHVARLRILGSYPRADSTADVPDWADSEPAYERASAWFDTLLGDIEAGSGDHAG